MTDTKIYPYSFEYARDSGELEAFRESEKLNKECAAAIDKAVADSRHDQHFYKLPAALDAVSKQFGLDRVTWVVAATIQHYNYDGRFSHANKEWAREFPIPDVKSGNFLLKTHPAVLDGFATTVQKTRLHNLAQTVGAYEKSHHMAERNRLTWFHNDLGGFIANPGVTEFQLSARCAEIAEKQSVLAQLRAARKAEKAALAPEKKRHETER